MWGGAYFLEVKLSRLFPRFYFLGESGGGVGSSHFLEDKLSSFPRFYFLGEREGGEES